MKRRPLNRAFGLMGFLYGELVGAGLADLICYVILPLWGFTPEVARTNLTVVQMLTLLLTPVLGCGLVGFIGCGYYGWFKHHLGTREQPRPPE